MLMKPLAAATSTRSTPARRRRAAAAMVLALVLAEGAAAQAPDLRGRARRIADDMAAQQASGRFDARAQQAAIQQLGQLALGFIDLSDRAVRAGTEAREKETLLGDYEAISAPLERIYAANSGKLEQAAKQVMDADGDLEALYETADWKEAQALASQTLYYLNWLHYYGARLYGGQPRKTLLEKAAQGFSEFAAGERRNELIIESLLGRGLAHLELGNYEWAARDFQIVVDDKDTSAERRAKARLGLLDAAYRSGKHRETIGIADGLLASESADAALIRYYRVRALLAAAKASAGAQAARYRQEAMSGMDQLRRAGAAWQEKVEALMQAELDDPQQFAAQAGSPAAKWTVARLLAQKGEYKEARPLLAAIVASSDADSKRVQTEAHYLLGLALFQAAEYPEAAAHFAAALAKPNPSYGADAAYMRFKALEAVAAKNPEAALQDEATLQDYEAAMRSYLAQYGDHRSAYEARYRLGEWLQAHKQFDEALEQYRQVSGDPGFELRARFGALQSRFELLQAGAEGKVTGAERQALIADIGKDLAAFTPLAADYERRGDLQALPLAEIRAKAAIMNAVHGSLLAPPRDEQTLATLTDFEQKYPNQSDLFAQVTRLRLGALQRLGRFAQAQAEVQAHGAALRADAKSDAIETLAAGFVKEGTRRKNKGESEAWPAAQQTALRLYELLLADSEGSNKTKLTLARLYEGAQELGKADGLYQEVLSAEPNSLAALRGLARIAEANRNPSGALSHWQRIAKTVRPGDLPWYEAAYETARLTLATGKADKSCAQLTELKPAMPGLSDADLRNKLSELYKRACR
ncbi:MAG: hypothetical protein HY699_16450 [Deltaproteobacteria bacterium]|nr:hypothetical protein [Deltaproteobacteria bacterium]